MLIFDTMQSPIYWCNVGSNSLSAERLFRHWTRQGLDHVNLKRGKFLLKTKLYRVKPYSTLRHFNLQLRVRAGGGSYGGFVGEIYGGPAAGALVTGTYTYDYDYYSH
jgi:hypothetical protein